MRQVFSRKLIKKSGLFMQWRTFLFEK